MRGSVDLNSDLGEGAGTDAAIMPLITSANIACGGHAGNESTMRSGVELAMRSKVAVGAHPGYPDRERFGRVALDMPASELSEAVRRQIDAIVGIASRLGARLSHVKAHGALYNHANKNPEVARGIAAGIASFRPDLLVVCQPGTELERAALEAGLVVANEGFIDRAYNSDGTLASRRLEGTLFRDPERAIEQALRMVTHGEVVAMDGTVVPVHVDTLCVHGDNPDAVGFISALRERLAAAGVELKPMREVVKLRDAPAPRPSGA